MGYALCLRVLYWPRPQIVPGALPLGAPMPWKQTSLGELGGVEVHNDQYRAHAQYRNSEGLNVHIRGPDRRDRRRALTGPAGLWQVPAHFDLKLCICA
jgi:hypothetical protein